MVFCFVLFCFAGSTVYTEENTQASTGSFGSNSENMNEDSNMSFPENSESNTMPEYSQDSNDADPEMRVGKFLCDGLDAQFATVFCPFSPSLYLSTCRGVLRLLFTAIK